MVLAFPYSNQNITPWWLTIVTWYVKEKVNECSKSIDLWNNFLKKNYENKIDF